jgi:hypothetical protein
MISWVQTVVPYFTSKSPTNIENNHANSLRGGPKPLPDQNVGLSVGLHLVARQVYNKHIFPRRGSGRSVNLTTPFQSTSLNCVKLYPLRHLYAFMSNTQDTLKNTDRTNTKLHSTVVMSLPQSSPRTLKIPKKFFRQRGKWEPRQRSRYSD